MKSEDEQDLLDVMPWLREAKERIYEETKHMTLEEQRRQLREEADNDPWFSQLRESRTVTPSLPKGPLSPS